MDEQMQKKAEEIIKKIQEDPSILEEIKKDPCDAIEKLADIKIPALLKGQINNMIKEELEKGTDPTELLSKLAK